MTPPRSSIMGKLCDALAAAVNQSQSQAVAATDLCLLEAFDKLSELTIRVTPYKTGFSAETRAATVRVDAQLTVWVADPGGPAAVAPGMLLVEDIANGIFRQRLQFAAGEAIQAVVTKAEIATVYDLERLQTSHLFLSAIRAHVVAWYTPC